MINELLFGLAWRVPLILVVMHFGEWLIHKHILHGMWLRRWKLTSYIPRWHAIEHHRDKQNKWHHINLSPPDYWVMLPFVIGGGIRYFGYGHVGGLAAIIATVGCSLFHMILWNKLHRAIHGLEPNNWISKMPYFQAFKKHHEDHHLRPTRNYGIVFIGIDHLMGTKYVSK